MHGTGAAGVSEVLTAGHRAGATTSKAAAWMLTDTMARTADQLLAELT
ncbi:hypothetical protein AB0I39_07490 [Kitasatospora purpeofusca]